MRIWSRISQRDGQGANQQLQPIPKDITCHIEVGVRRDSCKEGCTPTAAPCRHDAAGGIGLISATRCWEEWDWRSGATRDHYHCHCHRRYLFYRCCFCHYRCCHFCQDCYSFAITIATTAATASITINTITAATHIIARAMPAPSCVAAAFLAILP